MILNETHDIVEVGGGNGATKPFYAEAHRRKVPLNVQLQLTDRCNLRCEFCYNSLDHKSHELSVEEIRHILSQARELGTLFVCLTGGEPTMHPRFTEIARMVREMDFSLEVITNATLLTEQHFALFRELMPRYVAVSLHGLQQASHERLTRTPESFNRTVRSIGRMKELGIPVQLRIPITRYNYHELDELIMYAEALGIPHRMDCNITYREDGDPTGAAPRMLSAMQRAYYERNWRDYLRDNPGIGVIGHNPEPVDRGHLCAAGHTYCYVDSVGTLHPCPSYQRPIGSLREKSFAELWFGSEFLGRLRGMTHGQLEGCAGCGDKAFCSFCPGDSRNEGPDKQDGFASYPRACHNARINREAYEEIVVGAQTGMAGAVTRP